MRCPTCGAPVMVRKDSWECGYCCDCGNLPRRPEIVRSFPPWVWWRSSSGPAVKITARASPCGALLCAARSREAARQENTEEIPDTVPGSGSGLREDYDDLEDLHEDGDYKDLNEERNE